MTPKEIPNIYPLNFSDDQKLQFDLYVRQAKVLYPDVEEFSIKLAVEAFVRLGDRERPELTPDEIEAEKQKHNFETEVFETKRCELERCVILFAVSELPKVRTAKSKVAVLLSLNFTCGILGYWVKLQPSTILPSL